MDQGFNYSDERFADIQVLRYRLNGFEDLSLKEKLYIYYLSQATLYGRDITFDQFGEYNRNMKKPSLRRWKIALVPLQTKVILPLL